MTNLTLTGTQLQTGSPAELNELELPNSDRLGSADTQMIRELLTDSSGKVRGSVTAQHQTGSGGVSHDSENDLYILKFDTVGTNGKLAGNVSVEIHIDACSGSILGGEFNMETEKGNKVLILDGDMTETVKRMLSALLKSPSTREYSSEAKPLNCEPFLVARQVKPTHG